MFYCYILRSEKSGRFYVGSSADVQLRLLDHNAGKVTATRRKGPWKVMLTEPFATRSEAVRRELEIKSWKSSKAIQTLLDEIG